MQDWSCHQIVFEFSLQNKNSDFFVVATHCEATVLPTPRRRAASYYKVVAAAGVETTFKWRPDIRASAAGSPGSGAQCSATSRSSSKLTRKPASLSPGATVTGGHGVAWPGPGRGPEGCRGPATPSGLRFRLAEAGGSLRGAPPGPSRCRRGWRSPANDHWHAGTVTNRASGRLKAQLGPSRTSSYDHCGPAAAVVMVTAA